MNDNPSDFGDENTIPPISGDSRDDSVQEDVTIPPNALAAESGTPDEVTLPPANHVGQTDDFADDATIPPVGHAVHDDGLADDATLAPNAVSDGEPDLDTLPQSESSWRAGGTIRYFGDYELIDEIARGGMGVVYRAKQTNLNRIVALKMILAGQLAGEEEVLRFHAEAEAAANLDHSGIVPIYEVGEVEGQHYFSMGFVDGQSLSEMISERPMSPEDAADVTRKIAEAIGYAHEQGVIHRDLKPANVLVPSSRGARGIDTRWCDKK